MNDESLIRNEHPGVSGVRDERYTPVNLFTVSDSVNAWIWMRWPAGSRAKKR